MRADGRRVRIGGRQSTSRSLRRARRRPRRRSSARAARAGRSRIAPEAEAGEKRGEHSERAGDGKAERRVDGLALQRRDAAEARQSVAQLRRVLGARVGAAAGLRVAAQRVFVDRRLFVRAGDQAAGRRADADRVDRNVMRAEPLRDLRRDRCPRC